MAILLCLFVHLSRHELDFRSSFLHRRDTGSGRNISLFDESAATLHRFTARGTDTHLRWASASDISGHTSMAVQRNNSGKKVTEESGRQIERRNRKRTIFWKYFILHIYYSLDVYDFEPFLEIKVILINFTIMPRHIRWFVDNHFLVDRFLMWSYLNTKKTQGWSLTYSIHSDYSTKILNWNLNNVFVLFWIIVNFELYLSFVDSCVTAVAN